MIRLSVLLAGVLLLAACDAGAPVGHDDATVPTPTWAPPTGAPPAGTVTQIGETPASVAVEVGGKRTAVALPSAVLVLDELGTPIARVPTDAPATSVVPLPGGGFRALAGATVLTLPPSPAAPGPAAPAASPSLPASVASVPSATASSAGGAAARPSASVAVGTWPGVVRWSLPTPGAALAVPQTGDWTAVTVPDRGDVIIVSSSGAVSRTIDAGGRPGAVAADASRIAVVDPTQSSLTVFDAATGAKQEAVRAGDGATTVVADGTGRFVAVDARDGELLVFDTGPLLLRQRYPVPGAPYGVAYDPTRRILWVTVTQRNEVAGYDLSGGSPREVARHPAVRLPVAASADPSTGTVVVAGAAVGSAVGSGVGSGVGSAEGLVQRIGS